MPPKHTAPTVSSKRAAPAKKPNLTIHLQLDPKNAIHLLVKKGKRQVAKIDFTNEYKLLLFMYVLSIKHVHGINHAGVHGMQYVEAKAITVASKSFAVSGTVHTDDEWLDSDDDDVFTDDDDDEDDEEYDEEDDEEDDEEEDEESDTDSYEESYNGTEDEMYSDESSEDTSDMDDDTRKNYLCPNDDVENNSTKKAAPKPAAKKINSTPLNKNRRQKSTTKKTRNDDDDDLAYFFKERLGWSASEASIAINGDESLTRTFYRRLEEGAELVEITKKKPRDDSPRIQRATKIQQQVENVFSPMIKVMITERRGNCGMEMIVNKLRTTKEFLNFKIDEESYHPTFRSLLQVFKKVAVQVRRRTRPLISYNQASIRRRWASTISRTLEHFDTELSEENITPDQHILSRLEFSDEKMFQFNNIKRRIWAVRERE